MHRRAFLALIAGAPLIPTLSERRGVPAQARMSRQQAMTHNFSWVYGSDILFAQLWVSEPIVSHVLPRGDA